MVYDLKASFSVNLKTIYQTLFSMYDQLKCQKSKDIKK